MRVDIIEPIEVKRYTKGNNNRHYEDDTIQLNSGQQINAKYVQESSTGDLEVYVSDGSIINIPESLKKNVKYEEPEFVDPQAIEDIRPPRKRGGGCCGGR